MSGPDDVQAAIEHLTANKAKLRCREVIELLEALGFMVRDAKKQGHKVVTHPGLDDFFSTSFTCGHGRNPEIKPAYAVQLKSVLTTHENALRELQEKQR